MSLPLAPNLAMHDGHSIPQLGLGVWQVPEDQVEANVLAAIEVGYRHIDTAQGYENESGVGRAIAASPVPREQLFITTKLRNKLQGYDEALRAFDDSMKRLGLETLDLFLIHWPYPEANRYVDSWKAFVELREAGRVRSIGVSNFQPEHLERIIGETGVTPVINQVELHPHFQQRPLRAVHEKLGILTQAWSPLGRGRGFEESTVLTIAQNHGVTPAQAILRWHMQSGWITFPKSMTPKRLVENFDVFGFSFTPTEMQAMAALDDPGGRFGPKPEELNVPF